MTWPPGAFDEGIDHTPSNLFVESLEPLLCNLCVKIRHHHRLMLSCSVRSATGLER